MGGRPPLRSQGCARESDLEAHTFRILQIGNDLKQIVSGWIPICAKHLVKSVFARLFPTKFQESLRVLDRVEINSRACPTSARCPIEALVQNSRSPAQDADGRRLR